MKNRLTVIIISVCSAIGLCCCNGPYMPSDREVFLSRTSECMLVGYKDMIVFHQDSIQHSFNETKHLYRTGKITTKTEQSTGNTVELVEEFFILKLDSAPGDAGSESTGKLYLTSSSLTRSYDNLHLKVLKRENGMIWMWDETKKLGIAFATEGK